MKLSILIPVWNQEKLVIRALDHLPRRDDVEIIEEMTDPRITR